MGVASAYNQENLVWGQAFKMYLKRPALQFATMSSSTKPPAYFVEESDGRLYYNSLVSSLHDCSTAQYCLCKREHKTKHDELDDCFVCPRGYYTDVANTSVCKSCDIGKYNNFTKGDNETDCEVCPKGRYNEQIHQALCKICDRGKYADQTERTSEVGCKRCIAGRYNTEIEQKNVSACTKCGVGKYMNSSFLARITEADCTDCPKGKYSGVEGLDGVIGRDGGPEVNCKNCIAGRYNTKKQQNHSSACLLCGAGKYMDRFGFAKFSEIDCVRCPMGKYSGSEGLAGDSTEIINRDQDCMEYHRCSTCEGHCSSDSECATGLLCLKYISSMTHVPGCSPTNLILDKGYCYNATQSQLKSMETQENAIAPTRLS